MSDTRWLFSLRALPRAAAAVVACAATSALAQNAANGEVVYQTRFTIPVSGPTSCEDCHGPAYLFRRSAGQVSTAIAANRGQVMGTFSFLTPQQIDDLGAYMAVAQPPPPPPPVSPPPAGSPPAATPMASPNPAMLPNTVVGSTSTVVNLQFTNTAAANVTFNTPAIGAASGHASDFLVAAPTTGNAQCISGRVMAPGTSCWFGVQFAPSAVGPRAATWTIQFTGSVAARTITLEGMATTTAAPAPVPAPAPAPAPASAANPPTSGGGGAFGWPGLFGLLALGGAARLRRRTG